MRSISTVVRGTVGLVFAGTVLWLACGPAVDQKHLYLRNTTPNAQPGELVTLEAEAVDELGKPGTGTVEFSVGAGEFDDGTQATTGMLVSGKTTIGYRCDKTKDDKCHGQVPVLAKWESVPANVFIIIDNEVVAAGGGFGGGAGGSVGGGAGGGSGGGIGSNSYSDPVCQGGFNPDHMYLAGPTPDGTIDWWVVHDLDAPGTGVCAGWQNPYGSLVVRPLAHDIVYGNPGNGRAQVTVHVDDKAYYFPSENPPRWRFQTGQEGNDPPPFDAALTCGGGSASAAWSLGWVKAIPDSDEVIYRCFGSGNSGKWYRNLVELTSLSKTLDSKVYPGAQGYMVVFGSNNRIVDAAGNSVPLTNPGLNGSFVDNTVRSTTDGFFMLYESPGDAGIPGFDQYDQYILAYDGGLTRMGTYITENGVEELTHDEIKVFAKNGDLYTTGYNYDGGDARIVRFSITQPPTVVFRDSDQPANDWYASTPKLYVHVSGALVTGP